MDDFIAGEYLQPNSPSSSPRSSFRKNGHRRQPRWKLATIPTSSWNVAQNK
ncbi:hypothetical protein Syun_026986 [Stephania yunnanensis]|uniref:Uncharacterized protein n=1 Tax=Stephania yunnanensis TaxID=152371 RepID=A0AAP0EH22_9MAGN